MSIVATSHPKFDMPAALPPPLSGEKLLFNLHDAAAAAFSML